MKKHRAKKPSSRTTKKVPVATYSRHMVWLEFGAVVALVILITTSSIIIIQQFQATVEIPATVEIKPTISSTDMTEIVSGNTGKQQVIFTFDGGSGAESLNKILSVLSAHKVKGTFFLTGHWVVMYPELARAIKDQGHEIFNHTDSHPYLTQLSDEAIAEELADMDNSLQAIVGSSSRPYFRPPFGDRDARVLKVATEQGYRSVFWTTDALDWRETEGITDWEVKKIILSNLHPGAIFLMHIGDNITGRILDEIFTEIKARGYDLVSLTQGL